MVAQRLFLGHLKGRSGTFQTLGRGGRAEEEVGMAAAVVTARRALCFDPTWRVSCSTAHPQSGERGHRQGQHDEAMPTAQISLCNLGIRVP